jgi:putative ABC transport system permease protein
MRWTTRLRLRLRSLLRRSQVEGELDEELRYHVERQTDEFIAEGMSPTEARCAALRAMGGFELRREECRDSLGLRLVDELRQEVKYAIRTLGKSPGFTALAVFTLTLGIGANTAIFSAVHAVLLRPLPVRQPENLVICWGSDRSHSLAVVELSYRNFQDWTTDSRSFSQAAAIGSSTWPAVLDGRGESARLSSAGVSVSFFETLGVVPKIGRGFRPEDDVPKAPRVVVLSHGTWMTRFGADPQAVGTTIQLDEPHMIVGVMPEGFDFRAAPTSGHRSFPSSPVQRRYGIPMPSKTWASFSSSEDFATVSHQRWPLTNWIVSPGTLSRLVQPAGSVLPSSSRRFSTTCLVLCGKRSGRCSRPSERSC